MKLQKRTLLHIVSAALITVALFLSSQYNYLFFHILAEGFSIVIAYGMFMVIWNARQFMQHGYLQFLGIAYLFIGSIDALHTFAYQGMNIFPDYGANLSTQLWILARYGESVTFLVAPLFQARKFQAHIVLVGYGLISLVLVITAFTGYFPACFLPGTGLTTFKILSEYLIALLLAASILLLYQRRHEFDPGIVKLLIWSMLITISSEMAFTLYTDVYGRSNFIGHLLKILSFYLIYRAIIVTGLMSPYRLLFRHLKQEEDRLRESRDQLEQRVQERTAELINVNAQLQQEVAEHEQAEHALRESERRFRLLAENARDLIYRYRLAPTPGFEYVSPSATTITGYTPEEHYADPFLGVKLVHPEDRHLLEAMMSSAEAFTSALVLRWIRKDGSMLWTEQRNVPMYNEQGELVGLEGVARDITGSKLAEEALRESQKDLEDLVYIASHDLQTPIVSMVGYASSILKKHAVQLDEKGVYAVERLKANAERLHRLVLSLLDISRLNTMKNPYRTFSPETVVRDIVKDLSLRLSEADMTMTIEAMPPMYGDEARLSSVFRNLLTNAINYGANVIVVGYQDGAYFVRDNGIGIHQRNIKKIFRAGERLKKVPADGVGMGLTFCRKVILLHKGRMWAESDGEGRGATFYFTLHTR